MKPEMKPGYDWTKTLLKSLTTAGGFFVSFLIAVQTIELPEGVDNPEALTPGVVIALILAVLRALDNVRKQKK